MRREFNRLAAAALVFIVFVSCKMSSMSMTDEEEAVTADTLARRISITVGSRTFFGTLVNNETATTFKARLPLTILMTDLNANEKYYRLANGLPGAPSNPGRIENGDLMLYNSNTLVLFYKAFSTSYSYTRIGRVNNPSGLEAALGTGNITVKFALE